MGGLYAIKATVRYYPGTPISQLHPRLLHSYESSSLSCTCLFELLLELPPMQFTSRSLLSHAISRRKVQPLPAHNLLSVTNPSGLGALYYFWSQSTTRIALSSTKSYRWQHAPIFHTEQLMLSHIFHYFIHGSSKPYLLSRPHELCSLRAYEEQRS